MKFKGKLVQWDDVKGFGFIQPLGQQTQVFVHIKSFKYQPRRPQLQDTVTFTLTKDKQGRETAHQAKIIDAKAKAHLLRKTPSQGKFSLLLILSLAASLAMALYHDLLPSFSPLIYLLMSTITFIAYALDKSAARKGRWRTKESTLQLMALLGGWPGALLAQSWLRHKSQKVSFRVTLWCMIVLNSASLYWFTSSMGQTWLQAL
ncbi:DUF1294 domain-containing protein [Shewanella woodyi]|uniref:Cold-shock DNA-binding domain protein n=1 Tax=Shewanella woodyi (strain ATCC 51908 / MS32) TaxID=392500 RepID=B1KH88_SHEWM|nr:cold shock and DUF1294 domain-containing protein [Shewanella woodyi]ACA85396.1 cold-shock DNA-binding domain protein [Shewanella woodyi ATCC 51908]